MASAMDDTHLIMDSIAWLCGEMGEISIEKGKSALGAKMYTIEGKMKSKAARASLGRLNNDSLITMLNEGLDTRIDENKNLHIRLDLSRLVRGEAVLSGTSNASVAKGKFKLEVYPGQDPTSVAENVISKIVG
ncbi:MAG: hypothetical protein CMB67_04320 [Euryarchaeota archaeon]|nr:hypothetical protein [Euryarchaeota archaeon]